MKDMLLAVLMVALASVMFMCTSRTEETPAKQETKAIVAPGAATDKAETIQKNVQLANGDLRSMATALESYFVDFNAYPDSLYVLTTPIAYVTRVMADPFAQDQALHYKKLDNNDWVVWSVGPDGKDDDANIIYNPANGLESKGDIIRRKQ